jgi:hypothetical protein
MSRNLPESRGQPPIRIVRQDVRKIHVRYYVYETLGALIAFGPALVLSAVLSLVNAANLHDVVEVFACLLVFLTPFIVAGGAGLGTLVARIVAIFPPRGGALQVRTRGNLGRTCLMTGAAILGAAVATLAWLALGIALSLLCIPICSALAPHVGLGEALDWFLSSILLGAAVAIPAGAVIGLRRIDRILAREASASEGSVPGTADGEEAGAGQQGPRSGSEAIFTNATAGGATDNLPRCPNCKAPLAEKGAACRACGIVTRLPPSGGAITPGPTH